MAPHWKCGSGQPVAGSNPALSAIYARRLDADALRWRLRSSLTHAWGALARVLADAAFASTALAGGAVPTRVRCSASPLGDPR